MQIHTSLKVKVFIIGNLVILILLSVVPAIVALKASTQLRTMQTGIQTWASTAFVWGKFFMAVLMAHMYYFTNGAKGGGSK